MNSNRNTPQTYRQAVRKGEATSGFVRKEWSIVDGGPIMSQQQLNSP